MLCSKQSLSDATLFGSGGVSSGFTLNQRMARLISRTSVPCLFPVDAIYDESALVLSQMSHNACFLALVSSMRLKTEADHVNYFLGELIKNTLYKTQIAPP